MYTMSFWIPEGCQGLTVDPSQTPQSLRRLGNRAVEVVSRLEEDEELGAVGVLSEETP